MSDWTLGIDFGTSFTVAVVAEDRAAQPVDVEARGSDRLPSSVFLTEEGEILVGTAAQHQAKFAPDRYEPTPKRLMGDDEVFLGDRLVPIVELVGGVLRKAYTEACRQQGERAPSIVRLTYPATWAESRCKVLRDACALAQIPPPELITEPVAAAIRIALKVTQPDHRIAVYDFGGGTFDAAVLLRTDAGFEIAGPPAGRDPLGGEDIDQRIIDYLGELLEPDHPDEWQRLLEPPDAEWRGLQTELHAEVQRAKETLSEVEAAQLWVPGIKREVQLTRDELNQLIGADVDATIETLEIALRDAGVTANDLAGLYLVGGSSRIPLVADRLWRRLGVQPAVQDNPKLVVATGAAVWAGETPTATQSREVAGVPVSPRLVGRSGPPAWPTGCDWSVQMLIDRPQGEPLTLRLRDDPAEGMGTEQLAARARAQRMKHTAGFSDGEVVPVEAFGLGDGLERRFRMLVAGQPMMMFEQYLVRDGRALVLVCPEAGRTVAQTVSVGGQRDGQANQLRASFSSLAPAEWTVSEQLAIWRQGEWHSLLAGRASMGPDAVAGWRSEEMDRLTRLPGMRIVDQAEATVLGEVRGEVTTALWQERGQRIVTKLGVGTSEGLGVSLMITLPLRDQAMFAAMTQAVRLLP